MGRKKKMHKLKSLNNQGVLNQETSTKISRISRYKKEVIISELLKRKMYKMILLDG